MADVNCYAYAEDDPSCEVIRRLVEFQNQASETNTILRLVPGFPDNKHGCTQIRNRFPAIINMAAKGIATLVLTDLDRTICPAALIEKWTSKSMLEQGLPAKLWFRIAVRETESWLLADRQALADYLKIAVSNLDRDPDQLSDPKQYLMNVVRAKCRRKHFHEMLPVGNAHIGPGYNLIVCKFIRDHWIPERAAGNSPSLTRALDAMKRFQ